jgi:hypothetical protein
MNNPEPADMLKDKIAAVEAQMKARLDEIRVTFAHAGDKGASVEDSFRIFLRQYLPRRLAVGHGEIVDRQGRRSKQTDVVIATEDHPFTFTEDLPGLFFIEGVCGVGEVKTNLTAAELQEALEGSCQFKRMESGVPNGAMWCSNSSDEERFYKCPPWFLVALESQLTLPAILERNARFAEERAVGPNGLLDAVFVLGRGWVINFGDGKGLFQYRTASGESVAGWVQNRSDSVLFDLLGWLSIVMPRILPFRPILAPYMVRGPADTA